VLIILFTYFFIGLIASVIGAIAGLGGGVIIKPVLDFLQHYDVETINILASATVFAMASASLIRAKLLKFKFIEKTVIILAIGSVVGGIIGKTLFKSLIAYVDNNSIVSAIQAAILAVIMVCIFIFVKNKENIKMYQFTSVYLILLSGIFLGSFSAFLGVGGGPLNIPILVLLFSLGVKTAALNSLIIIFFSQLTSLTLMVTDKNFASYDLSMMGYMVLGGVLGGFIGITLYSKLSNLQVDRAFIIVVTIVFFINVYNVIRYFI